MGGKDSLTDKGWLDSVESLDLTYYLQPYLRKGDEAKNPVYEDVKWQNVANMHSKRANFAALVINNEVYVYGGIEGKEGSHKPLLTKTIIEKYSPNSN